jgi:molybdate transport system substrate-binding protein
MPKYAIRLLAAALPLLALFAGAGEAAELKVVCSGGMRAVLQELGPAFEKETGHKLSVEYATAGKVEEKVAADEPIDVAILTKPRADKLIRAAKLVGGSTETLASVPIGLAIKKGAPKPDIGSVDAFKKTLLSAKSIAYIDPATGGTSGIHMAQVMEKLGLANELKPKIHLIKPPAGQNSARVGEVVAKGEAELGLQPISELKEVEAVDVVGPLPKELQSPDLVFVAGSPFFSEQPIPAKQLIDFLAGQPAKAVYKAKGMEPS